MKIVHMCLANYYTDNFGYQENMLPMQNKMDGHEVTIIASTETYVNNKELGYVNPGEYQNEHDIKVIRIPYRRIFPHKIMRKIRAYPNVYKILNSEKPDVILFHGSQSYDLLNVVKYKNDNPRVKLYVDNHADRGNSAKGFISKNVLHKFYYKKILQKCLPYIDKIFYVTYERKLFLEDIYDVNEEKMEFYPLGGTVVEREERLQYRNQKRDELRLTEEDIVLVHAGKMNANKKTLDIVNSFSKISDKNLKLILIGSITDNVKKKIMPFLKKDKRIVYLGWKPADELNKYFCASDLYVQPGSHTVLMEQATCCSLPVIVANLKSYEYLLQNSKHAWIISNSKEMIEIFENVGKNPSVLEQKTEHAYEFAKEVLDYKKLAARLER